MQIISGEFQDIVKKAIGDNGELFSINVSMGIASLSSIQVCVVRAPDKQSIAGRVKENLIHCFQEMGSSIMFPNEESVLERDNLAIFSFISPIILQDE